MMGLIMMMKGSLFIILMGVGIFTTEAKAKQKLHCDHSNYKEYIYDADKTTRLVEQTGKGCQLAGVDFNGADLNGADLRGASLRKADLRGAGLSGADLGGAYFSGADLRRVDLRRANLDGARFAWANLSGAKLARANLASVNLAMAYLGEADLKGAKYNDETIFPTLFPTFFSRRGKGLVKISSKDPCALGELTFWESFIGIKAGSLFEKGQQCNSSTSATAINDSDRNSRAEKTGENNDQNLDERGSGVLR